MVASMHSGMSFSRRQAVTFLKCAFILLQSKLSIRKVLGESIIINFVLNRTEHALSMCLRRATPSAYLVTVVRA